jgi:hypothetical protein
VVPVPTGAASGKNWPGQIGPNIRLLLPGRRGLFRSANIVSSFNCVGSLGAIFYVNYGLKLLLCIRWGDSGNIYFYFDTSRFCNLDN